MKNQYTDPCQITTIDCTLVRKVTTGIFTGLYRNKLISYYHKKTQSEMQTPTQSPRNNRKQITFTTPTKHIYTAPITARRTSFTPMQSRIKIAFQIPATNSEFPQRSLAICANTIPYHPIISKIKKCNPRVHKSQPNKKLLPRQIVYGKNVKIYALRENNGANTSRRRSVADTPPPVQSPYSFKSINNRIRQQCKFTRNLLEKRTQKTRTIDVELGPWDSENDS